MDVTETDEIRDLRAAVGAIAAPYDGSYYVEHAREGRECAELWHALGDAGFIGVNIPEEYGGGGCGLAELTVVCEEIAARGAPILLLLVTAAISAEVIAEFGSEEQCKEWLPGLASEDTDARALEALDAAGRAQMAPRLAAVRKMAETARALLALRAEVEARRRGAKNG